MKSKTNIFIMLILLVLPAISLSAQTTLPPGALVPIISLILDGEDAIPDPEPDGNTIYEQFEEHVDMGTTIGLVAADFLPSGFGFDELSPTKVYFHAWQIEYGRNFIENPEAVNLGEQSIQLQTKQTTSNIGKVTLSLLTKDATGTILKSVSTVDISIYDQESAPKVVVFCSDFVKDQSLELLDCGLNFPDPLYQPYASPQKFQFIADVTDPSHDTIYYYSYNYDLPFQDQTTFLPMQIILTVDGSPSETVDLSIQNEMRSPCQAIAGIDQTVVESSNVILDGSQSVLYEGETCSYQWQYLDGDSGSITLQDAFLSTSNFAAPSAGEINPQPEIEIIQVVVDRFKLIVIDNYGNPATEDTVEITTTLEPPTVVASSVINGVLSTDNVYLFDASYSQPTPGLGLTSADLEYSWEIVEPKSRCSVWFSESNYLNLISTFFTDDEVKYDFCTDGTSFYSTQAKPYFHVDFNVRPQPTVKLTVSNGPISASRIYNITISGAYRLAEANAGRDHKTNVLQQVTLDASKSLDFRNEDPSTTRYKWQLIPPPESRTVLDQDSISNLPTRTFTPDVNEQYSAILQIDDGTGYSDPHSIWIMAGEAYATRPPLAHAGGVQYVDVKPGGEVIQLSAAQSTVEDGFSLTYQWTPLAYPADRPVLSDSSVMAPIFTAVAEGKYIFHLRVDNGSFHDEDQVVVFYGKEAPDDCPIAIATSPVSMKNRSHLGAVLDASQSRSPGGTGELSYHWELVTFPSNMTDEKPPWYGLEDQTLPPSKKYFWVDEPYEGTFIVRVTVDNGYQHIAECSGNKADIRVLVRD